MNEEWFESLGKLDAIKHYNMDMGEGTDLVENSMGHSARLQKSILGNSK